MINSSRFYSKIPILILGLACIVFSLYGIKEVYRIPYLYTLDPGFHYTTSQVLDAEEPLGLKIQTFDGAYISAEYPSALRTFLVALHEASDISYLDLFKVFGIFCRIFTAFVIFYVARYLFTSERVALIVALLFLSSYYVFFRAIITFPENLVVPFHILVFYEVIRSIRSGNIQILLPIYIAGSLLIHYPSGIITIILVVPLAFFVIKDFFKQPGRRKSLLVQVVLFSLLLIFLSSPVLTNFIERYQKYLVVNVGKTALELISQRGEDRYEPLSAASFGQNLGKITLLFSLISIPILIFSKKRENSVILLWFIVAFVLSRGSQFALFIPTGRMLIYLLIPMLFAAGYAIKKLSDFSQNNFIFSFLLPVILLIILVGTVNGIHGWQAIKDSELQQAQWLNEHVDEKTVILNDRAWLENAGFLKFKNLETRQDVYKSLFEGGLLNSEKLSEYYPGKRVLFVANSARSLIVIPSKYQIQSSWEDSVIYDLGTQNELSRP